MFNYYTYDKLQKKKILEEEERKKEEKIINCRKGRLNL
jgi:hypothetical protein